MDREKALKLVDKAMLEYTESQRAYEEFWLENTGNEPLAVCEYKKYLLKRYLACMCAGMYVEAGLILKEIQSPFGQKESIKPIYDNDDITLVPLAVHNGTYVCYSMEHFVGPDTTLYYRPILTMSEAFRYRKGHIVAPAGLDNTQEMFSAFLFLNEIGIVDTLSTSWRQRAYARRLAERIPKALMGDDKDIVCSALIGAINYLDMQ